MFKRVDGTVEERLMAKTMKASCGCWIFLACHDKEGYGKLHGKLAHVASYEIYKGVVPNGFEIDHLCRVRSCVNPAHLEAVPHLVNMTRSWKNACRKGHLLTEENTYVQIVGNVTNRRCRTCGNAAARRYMRRNKMSDGSAGAPSYTVDQVVAIHQQAKADIAALSAKHAKEMEPLAKRVEVATAWLLKWLLDNKSQSHRLDTGVLIYKSQVMSATVDPEGGWEKLFGFILVPLLERVLDAAERNATEEEIIAEAMQAPTLALLNHAVNKTAVKELMEQEVVVPGVKVAHVAQLGVRKS